MTHPWTLQDIPSQAGRVALVTGANAGTGFEAARELAARSATVVLGCRDGAKAERARARILEAHPGAAVEILPLDLASLASVARAAEALAARHGRLDLLVNNAGVMIPPEGRTEDGFETQFGTNHLGPFALTGRLLPLLLATPGSRVVTMSSIAHKSGRMRFEDLQFASGYRAWPAYAQSKLANLLFTFELQRRLAAKGASTLAVAAHPGWARTELQRHAYGNPLMRILGRPMEALFSHDALAGALPLLRAATEPGLAGGEYFGPTGFQEMKGAPGLVRPLPRARDAQAQERLWRVSEALTGVAYPL
ncbi:MAG TPA: oxidoreductase [Holophaga sp.]|nr:oxidoreductase [Holophaga sp.]